jgi:hypothetical protein
MPIPTIKDDAPAEYHPTPSYTPAQALRLSERSRLHRIPQHPDYPSELLDHINEAHDQANQQDPEQEPGERVYVMTHSSVQVFSEPIFLIESVFTTLKKANTAVMNFFRTMYGSFFREKGGLDRSNFFWLSDETPGHNRVGWRVESSG